VLFRAREKAEKASGGNRGAESPALRFSATGGGDAPIESR